MQSILDNIYIAGGIQEALVALPGVLAPSLATGLYMSQKVAQRNDPTATFELAAICGTVAGYAVAWVLAGLLRGQVASVWGAIVGKTLIAIGLWIGAAQGVFGVLTASIGVFDWVLMALFYRALPSVQADLAVNKPAERLQSGLAGVAALDAVAAFACIAAGSAVRAVVMPYAGDTAVADSTVLCLGALLAGLAVSNGIAATQPSQVGAVLGGAIAHLGLAYGVVSNTNLFTGTAATAISCGLVAAAAITGAALPSVRAEYDSQHHEKVEKRE